ncbi:hypothetical protein [Actinoplanes sp. NPDC049118]|uniref:hypothetical protein n=1 Tax=Actinoplanes sp. NPDC049118 TaxID=3155769 RepID=UPI0033F4B8BF
MLEELDAETIAFTRRMFGLARDDAAEGMSGGHEPAPDRPGGAPRPAGRVTP